MLHIKIALFNTENVYKLCIVVIGKLLNPKLVSNSQLYTYVYQTRRLANYMYNIASKF